MPKCRDKGAWVIKLGFTKKPALRPLDGYRTRLNKKCLISASYISLPWVYPLRPSIHLRT